MRIKFTTATLLCFLATFVQAQQEIGLHFMRHVWQANKTNPAIVQPDAFVLEVTGIRNSTVFSGLTYNEIVVKRDGKSVIDIDRMISFMDPQNTVREDLEFSTLSAAVRLQNLTLSLGHSLKYHAYLDFPRELPELIWQGNAQFIGETVDLSHELLLTGYHELALGAAYQFGNLTLGAKGKFLSGIANVTTDDDHHHASFFTDADVYQITLNGDYILHTANSVRYENYDEVDTDFTFGSFTFENFFSGNTGFAFDLGARLQLDKFDLSASLLDLGSITWDDEVTTYSATKTIEYDGLDFSAALTGGDSTDLENALDTLEALFQPEKSFESYSNKLPRRIYLSAMFQLNNQWSMGATYFTEQFRGNMRNAFALGATWSPIDLLTVGATYAIKDENDSYDNIGLNLAFQLGPVQIFGVTDNLIALINAGDSKNFSARAGLALMLGKKA